jgi:hypothetical protein
MTTNEYYNVVINPGDIPVLGIDDTAERPLPLPDPEPEPERNHVRNIDVRSVKIRGVYKFMHFIMLFITIMGTIMISDNYRTLMDTFMSAISYVSVLENNIYILKMHIFYLSVCFTLASYNFHFEYIIYYFVYSLLNVCTLVHLAFDRRDYYINELISVFPNP